MYLMKKLHEGLNNNGNKTFSNALDAILLNSLYSMGFHVHAIKPHHLFNKEKKV